MESKLEEDLHEAVAAQVLSPDQYRARSMNQAMKVRVGIRQLTNAYKRAVTSHHDVAYVICGDKIDCFKEAPSVLMLCALVFIFTSGSSALLGRPRCGLSI